MEQKTVVPYQLSPELFDALIANVKIAKDKVTSTHPSMIHVFIDVCYHLIHAVRLYSLSDTQCQIVVNLFTQNILPTLLVQGYYASLKTFYDHLTKGLVKRACPVEALHQLGKEWLMAGDRMQHMPQALPPKSAPSYAIATKSEFSRLYTHLSDAAEKAYQMNHSTLYLCALKKIIHMHLSGYAAITDLEEHIEYLTHALMLCMEGKAHALKMAKKEVAYFNSLTSICFAHYFERHTQIIQGQEAPVCLAAFQSQDAHQKGALFERLKHTADTFLLQASFIVTDTDQRQDFIPLLLEKAKRLYELLLHHLHDEEPSFVHYAGDVLEKLKTIIQVQTNISLFPTRWSSLEPIAFIQWQQHQNTLKENRTKLAQSLTQIPIGKMQGSVKEYNQTLRHFLGTLFEETIHCSGKQLPFAYAFIGLGSLGRQEACPYSDVECALVVDATGLSPIHKTQSVFILQLFKLSMIALGEMPDEGRAYSDLAMGFRLDDKYTPLSRIRTLWGTAENILEYIDERNMLGDIEGVSILYHSCLLHTNAPSFGKDLYQHFHHVLQEKLHTLNAHSIPLRQRFADILVENDSRSLTPFLETALYVDIKKSLVRPIVFLSHILSLRTLSPLCFSGTWDTLEKLYAEKNIDALTFKLLHLYFSFSLYMRYSTHLYYGEEKETAYFEEPGQSTSLKVFTLNQPHLASQRILASFRKNILPLLHNSLSQPQLLHQTSHVFYQETVPALIALADDYMVHHHFPPLFELHDIVFNIERAVYLETQKLTHYTPAKESEVMSLLQTLLGILQTQTILTTFSETSLSAFSLKWIEEKKPTSWVKWHPALTHKMNKALRHFILAHYYVQQEKSGQDIDYLRQAYVGLALEKYHQAFWLEYAYWYQADDVTLQWHPLKTIPDATGTTLAQTAEQQLFYTTLAQMTEEYDPAYENFYQQQQRVSIEWLEVNENKIEPKKRLFPKEFFVKGKFHPYFDQTGMFYTWEHLSDTRLKKTIQDRILAGNDRRLVLKLYHEDKVKLFAKIYPEAPGVQLQADRLTQRLSGINFQTLLCKLTPLHHTDRAYPVLLSQAIPGESLQAMLRKGRHLTDIDHALDPFYFTLKVLETLLLYEEDGKPDNFIAEPLPNGLYRLITVDGDHAFDEPLLKKITPRGTTLTVQLKSMVFCFSQMKKSLEPTAIALFKSLDPMLVMTHWLNELMQWHMASVSNPKTRLFNETQILELLEPDKSFFKTSKGDHTCLIPAIFQIGTVQKIYIRFRRLQAIFHQNDDPVIDHFMLLRRIEPQLCYYYEKVYQKSNPQARFESLSRYTNYKIIEEPQTGLMDYQSVQGVRQRAQASLTIVDKALKKALKENFKEKAYYTPQLAFDKELIGIDLNYMQMAMLLQQLLQGNLNYFVQTFPYIQEQVLKKLDFHQVQYGIADKQQKRLRRLFETHLLEALNIETFKELHIKNCRQLTTDTLDALLRKGENLRILMLVGCKNLNRSLSYLEVCQQLEILNLTDTAIPGLHTYLGFGKVSLPELKQFIMKNNVVLKNFKLSAPQLKKLHLDDCQSLEKISGSFPQLEELSINYCIRLSEAIIIKFIQSAPQLKYLRLAGCTVHASILAPLRLPALEYVTLDMIHPSLPLQLSSLKTLTVHKKGVLEKTFLGHKSSVTCGITYLHTQIISGSSDNTINLWNIKKGLCIKTLKGLDDWISNLALLSPGHIISASYDKTLKIWQMETATCLTTLSGHLDAVLCVIPLTGTTIVSGSKDGTLKIWDTQTGNCLQTLTGHTDWISCLATFSQTHQIVSSTMNGEMKLWDSITGQCIRSFSGHPQAIKCLLTLENGHIISGSKDKTLKIWEAKTGRCIKTLTGHQDTILCLTLLSKKCFASGSADQSIKLWDLHTGHCLYTFIAHKGWINCLMALGETTLISGGDDHVLKVWSFDSIRLPFHRWPHLEVLEINHLNVSWHTQSSQKINVHSLGQLIQDIQVISDTMLRCRTIDALKICLLLLAHCSIQRWHWVQQMPIECQRDSQWQHHLTALQKTVTIFNAKDTTKIEKDKTASLSEEKNVSKPTVPKHKKRQRSQSNQNNLHTKIFDIEDNPQTRYSFFSRPPSKSVGAFDAKYKELFSIQKTDNVFN